MEVRLERLVGRRVVDRDGRGIGHIEEVRAEEVGGELRVVEYLTGTLGARRRLMLATLPLHAAGVLGIPLAGSGYRIPWRELDLTDPDRPRTRCRREELPRDGG
ncbi:MAG TPA: PRC-barrel domain-containing protein [Longimicrobiales bacterium]|nr:PRC-barrel domain-containing protein [Longimicrobiales bacterium]